MLFEKKLMYFLSSINNRNHVFEYHPIVAFKSHNSNGYCQDYIQLYSMV